MKRLFAVVWLALVACLVLGPSPAALAQAAGGAAIEFKGEAGEAIADLRACLEGYEAGPITIEKVELGQRTGQEFYLERTGGTTLIRYTTANSLDNAVYTLLDHLGFRWYGPGENWFVKPAKLDAAEIS